MKQESFVFRRGRFNDATGSLWASNALVGKVGSCFTSSSSQHGGQESTLLSMQIPLFHLGFIIVGLPYSFQEQTTIDELVGCSPYGASSITGSKGERLPSPLELKGARFQGKHVASITKKLFS